MNTFISIDEFIVVTQRNIIIVMMFMKIYTFTGDGIEYPRFNKFIVGYSVAQFVDQEKDQLWRISRKGVRMSNVEQKHDAENNNSLPMTLS